MIAYKRNKESPFDIERRFDINGLVITDIMVQNRRE
jgi:hypothetical protein